jgi:hypothetical protein
MGGTRGQLDEERRHNAQATVLALGGILVFVGVGILLFAAAVIALCRLRL